ncbi:protein FAR1-RELATED SEQUENCE 4-like [Prunus dulcis]|uniref:protein FAR1-RELATED SEQUENCE 4-like n=1 Tax=Prunus dulcis TaxID=3755 RepID=UPI00148219E3|nr:protein FAR1-RELATED SEQUENCE 4-like [Prunus dulcis]
MAKQYGGYEKIGFLEKDIRNHLDKERRLALESGDAKAMLELFTRMQEENPNFFYAMDLDEEQRLVNVFWVDAKGREDYKNFGDVISFDTTYITNKYKMPFAPFIGVNNHSQSTLLGCALLADETTCTFVWLMKTWIRAMGGKAPSAILTDQDQAMKAAITEVFPNARHRFCLWHILRKIPQKLGEVLRKHGNFMGMFNNCIYNSWTVEDFEQKWQNMVEVFELDNNEWIKSLFEDRKFWVPTYMRDAFFAGMSTTQRSESINSFFDKYVNKKTTLKEFVEKYKVALQDREEAATHADFKTLHKEPTLKSPSPFEKQMHAIAMLQSSGVFRIPSHYILKRWTKDARNGYTSRHMSKEVDPKKQHFNDLFRKANKLIEEGSLSQESYDIVNHALEKALKQCASINHSLNGTSYDFHSVDKENVNNNVLCDINVLDPRVSNTKGAPKRVKNQNSNGTSKSWTI